MPGRAPRPPVLPRRERLGLLLALVAVLALSWGWLLAGAGMGMSAIDMTAMAGMDGWLMQPPTWTPAYAALMLAMWWVMMAAMMLPSAAPMLLLFARVHRKAHADDVPWAAPLQFAAGYLLVWGGFSLVATALQWALQALRLMSPMMETTAPELGAGLLIAAGVWQLTPLKARCLGHCRSPLGFLSAHWRSGRFGAVRMGLAHGAYCLGCCWFLMALLFFGGVMNLYWITGLSVYVLLEKTLPWGHWLGRAAGVGLIAWGLALALA
jgi:predicted metal-binding membrane protein